ncbi:Cytochrome c-554(548) [Vibrio vulnificus]|uniref:c-type cytochrome n=1 Tax=Vibrio vulnificus TaxID=672 RepID=UPI00092BC5E7|nr:cytochrome c [Vibrio vulnificus]EHT4939691.1 cytochrome c [Vibrio vulnificus]OJI27993.1 Cytochrome c-554(548) [Vibrio vulnificus]OJI52646.1 Cytochrome c-554(548) [Vibrio vulnificus]POB01283.1 cytochrome C554 [Vibrio vulnificus]
MLRPILCLVATAFTFTAHANANANANALQGNPELGKVKSPSCVFCHGASGVAANNAYPHLAGQNEQYLFDSMKSYQNGQRTGPLADMMQAQLQRLNDQDLRDVAAYYAQQTR